jgi:mRNA deadenylase 3'-5' endonuclease subunit Ccr4
MKVNKKKIETLRGNEPMAGITCLIKKINSGCQFVLSTVHLISNPELSDVKHLQTLAVLKSLELMSNNGKIPSILCGDFNSLPSSSVYDTITNGNINYEHSDFKSHKNSIITKKKRNKFIMNSAYKKYHGYEAPFTNYTDIFNGTLDYIFISNEWKIRHMNNIPSIKDITNEIAIPNSIFPSDHIPLICNLYF